MLSLRFLQFSDLHLDCSLTGARLGLPAQKRARINHDIERALAKAVELARSEDVDVVLCPGDLWDDEAVSFQSATTIYDMLGSLSPIPVVLTPGNHDPLNAFSYHHAAYFRSKVGKPHPRNVTVMCSPRIERRTLPQLPDVDFYGCCFEQNQPRRERLLQGLRPEREDVLSVLVLHGSQDDMVTPNPDQLMVAPFSRQELLACGFDYAALGHYHRFSQVEDDRGMVRGAYAGIPAARALSEVGEHYVLIGEIDRGGVRPDRLRKIAVDTRRVLRLSVDIDSSVSNSAAARDRIADALAEADAAENDIAYVTLEGRTHPEVTRFDFDPAWCDAQCFHLAIDQTGLEPEYDVETLLNDEAACKRIEGRFASRMRQLLEQSEGDPQKQRIIRSALCYGLDAIKGREVRPRRVY
jgi:DNA repair protein SbcD/Mre11